jgi:hypothetical protein
MTFANKFMVVFTGVIAVSTVLYAAVATLQLRALIASNRINRDALETVQRAYVTFSPTSEIGTTVEGGKVVAWQAHIPMRNGGATSTKGLVDNVEYYFSDSPLSDDFEFPETQTPMNGALGPKDEIQVRTANIPIGQVASVQRKLGHIYVYGWATYRDIFPETRPHLTLFCYELFPNTILSDVTSIDYKLVATFAECKDHNCNDDECRTEKLPKDFRF